MAMANIDAGLWWYDEEEFYEIYQQRMFVNQCSRDKVRQLTQKRYISSYFKVAVKRQLSSNILFATITWHECWMPLHLNWRVQNKDWPWLWVSSRYSEQALIIALLVILNSVARSLVIFTLAWMSVTSGFLSPLPPVAVSSSETDLWRAWLCFTMRSLHVLRSSSLVDIIL